LVPSLPGTAGGYPVGNLRARREHFRGGDAELGLARLLGRMRLRWHGGAAPVPRDTQQLIRRNTPLTSRQITTTPASAGL
jgi:hypothetical protein